MPSTLTVYTIKWKGPYKEDKLPHHKENMIYLWTGKTGPKQKKNKPCYCGITGRGCRRFNDQNHKKNLILKNSRKCWVGVIIGGKRRTSNGQKNTAFERTEHLLVYFLKNLKSCCSKNERKANSFPKPVGVYNIFLKTNGDEYSRKSRDVSVIPKILLWNGVKVIVG